MKSKTFSSLSHFQFNLLGDQKGLLHYVSGREGGVTEGPLGTLNLSFKVGDHPDNVKENRRRVAASMGIDPDKLIFPDQTHSINVKRIKTGLENLEDTDALITSETGVCISVMSADCVPVLLYDPHGKACAAIHSGWKGTVGKIALRTVEEMIKEFNSDPANIIACIGPSICQKVYQVGPEVIKEVKDAFGCGHDLINNLQADGKAYLNLWDANRLQLIGAGVKEANIEISGMCTYLNSDKFFSARKSKNNTGRFAAGIMLT